MKMMMPIVMTVRMEILIILILMLITNLFLSSIIIIIMIIIIIISCNKHHTYNGDVTFGGPIPPLVISVKYQEKAKSHASN